MIIHDLIMSMYFLHHQVTKSHIFLDDSLLDRLAKIASNPFQDWSYSSMITSSTDTSIISSNDSTANDAASSQNTKTTETIPTKSGIKRGRKRTHPVTTQEQEPKKVIIDPKSNKEKECKGEKEQIQLQELYYATMEGDKNLILKEYKSAIYFKVCFKQIILLVYFTISNLIYTCFTHMFTLVFPLHNDNEV